MLYEYPSSTDEVDSGQMLGANLGRGQEYKDPHFPATGRSLNFSGHTPPGFAWKRPYELCPNPVFIEDNVSQYDISQGELKNCWFMAAAAAMAATNRKLILRVIMPVKQGFGREYTGRFVFQFWQYDRWMKVSIDDRLPTSRGRLIYGHNTKNPREFWAPLLEKAFAKLYGCYEALSGGRIHHAFVDLSGGISELVPLRPDQPTHSPTELFTLLDRTLRMNSLLGAAIFKSDRFSSTETLRVNGLYEGHAYSITSIKSVTDTSGQAHHLLRVRNPWGRKEWKGRWSDGSPMWSKLRESDRDDLRRLDHDGEFWINMEDFIENFDEVELTHLTPDALTNEVAEDMEKKVWETTVHKDAWVRGVSAGGCGNKPYIDLYWKNPQFRLTLDPQTNGSTVVISLMEVLTDRHADISIGFDIYQLREGYPEEPLGEDYDRGALVLKKNSGTLIPYRELTLRFELNPGKYVIIPSTFHPHQEAEFFLKVFAEKKTRSWALDWNVGEMVSEDEAEDLLARLFSRVVGSDKLADPENLRDILTKAKQMNWGESDGFAMETCRSLLAANDQIRSRDGEIDLNTTRTIWRDVNSWRDAYKALWEKKGKPVDTYDLRDLYKTVGLPVGKDPLRSIARRYGGHSGRISFEDFVTSCARIQSMRRSFRQIRNRTSVDRDITLDVTLWLSTVLYQ